MREGMKMSQTYEPLTEARLAELEAAADSLPVFFLRGIYDTRGVHAGDEIVFNFVDEDGDEDEDPKGLLEDHPQFFGKIVAAVNALPALLAEVRDHRSRALAAPVQPPVATEPEAGCWEYRQLSDRNGAIVDALCEGWEFAAQPVAVRHDSGVDVIYAFLRRRRPHAESDGPGAAELVELRAACEPLVRFLEAEEASAIPIGGDEIIGVDGVSLCFSHLAALRAALKGEATT